MIYRGEYSGSRRLKTIKRERKKNYNESRRAWSSHKVYTLASATTVVVLPVRSHVLMARHNHLWLTKVGTLHMYTII